MHAVRKRILEILKEQTSGATVAELAELLEMAPVSVRHHLDILQGDDLICVDRLERKGNVGRPQQVYALTEEASRYFPNNFAALASGLVGQIKQLLPPEQVPCAFRSLAQEMAAEFTESEVAATCDTESAAFEERLEQIATFLTERGYLARWEPSPGQKESSSCASIQLGNDNSDKLESVDGSSTSYLLHKYNCPYAGLSTEHTELCLMDQTLISELTGCKCERTQSLAEGAACCTYRMTLEAATEAAATEPTKKQTTQRIAIH